MVASGKKSGLIGKEYDGTFNDEGTVPYLIRVHTFVKTHQIVPLKFIYFIVYKVYKKP